MQSKPRRPQHLRHTFPLDNGDWPSLECESRSPHGWHNCAHLNHAQTALQDSEVKQGSQQGHPSRFCILQAFCMTGSMN